MRITWVSRAGDRRVNTDAFGKLTGGGITCIVAADGLGSDISAAVASKTAVQTVLDAFKTAPEFTSEALRGYISRAHETVFKLSAEEPEYVGMSSTVAVLLIKGRRALWASVGDTRIYRLRRGRIAEVTEDHSLAFKSFMDGNIEYDDIRRSEERNKLTNSLGLYIKDIYISEITAADSETCFLICTDGLWVPVSDQTIEHTLRASSSPKGWLEKLIAERDAQTRTGGDCYTAAVLSMQ